MQTVVETPEFKRAAKELKLSAVELARIIDLLADNPMLGDEIAGTGGARKWLDPVKAKAVATALFTFFQVSLFLYFY